VRRRAVYFSSPGEVDLRPEDFDPPDDNQVLVKTLLTGISPGTELLVYNGLFPQDLAADTTISALAAPFGYPMKYGYCAVGQVIDAGRGVEGSWVGRKVFAFQPHQSHFTAAPEAVIPIPAGISEQDAVFLPNMETAVNFILDGAPLIGEQVIVFGQGIVGLLTLGLLARFPLGGLYTVDRYPLRREASLQWGADASFDSDSAADLQALRTRLPDGADLTYEVSGAPAALNQAIGFTGFDGRILVGSWYGRKPMSLDLGGYFHRSRIRLISSQVSTLAPALSGRWSKIRRFDLAWDMIRQLSPSRWITHRFPAEDAARAYRLLDRNPGEAIQVIFTYINQ
jgi:2-desacetyl-2-hydroxyethyl bacteriochlorophyllide A dehydrogenase